MGYVKLKPARVLNRDMAILFGAEAKMGGIDKWRRQIASRLRKMSRSKSCLLRRFPELEACL